MPALHRNHFYIDGNWVAPTDASRSIEVMDSVTEESLEFVPAGSVEDVERAVRAARAALESWAAHSVSERADYIRRLAVGIRARVDEIAPLISREVGMPIEGARSYQTLRATDLLSSFADLAPTIEFEEMIGDSIIVKEPAGVVGAIGPSNFPLLLSLVKIGPALVAGCTMVLKPPETAPGSLFIVAEVAQEIGLPRGVLNILTGFGPEVGEALAAHPEVDMISFTGSTGVGRRLLEIGSQTVKRAHLELGGKSAALVLDDANLQSSLRTVLDQAFINAGQICFAWSRLVVPRATLPEAEAILRELLGELQIGDPLDASTTLGPLVTKTAQARVNGYISDALNDGARLIAGGTDLPREVKRGYFVKPTVLSGVENSMKIAQNEVFGPVVALIAHDGDSEAVRIANDSTFGLHGAVFSADDDRAMRVARQMRTGQVDINGFKLGMYAPFGGYKQSGLGRELGLYGIQEYLEVKAIQL